MEGEGDIDSGVCGACLRRVARFADGVARRPTLRRPGKEQQIPSPIVFQAIRTIVSLSSVSGTE
jgi:hypothetical protein